MTADDPTCDVPTIPSHEVPEGSEALKPFTKREREQLFVMTTNGLQLSQAHRGWNDAAKLTMALRYEATVAELEKRSVSQPLPEAAPESNCECGHVHFEHIHNPLGTCTGWSAGQVGRCPCSAYRPSVSGETAAPNPQPSLEVMPHRPGKLDQHDQTPSGTRADMSPPVEASASASAGETAAPATPTPPTDPAYREGFNAGWDARHAIPNDDPWVNPGKCNTCGSYHAKAKPCVCHWSGVVFDNYDGRGRPVLHEVVCALPWGHEGNHKNAYEIPAPSVEEDSEPQGDLTRRVKALLMAVKHQGAAAHSAEASVLLQEIAPGWQIEHVAKHLGSHPAGEGAPTDVDELLAEADHFAQWVDNGSSSTRRLVFRLASSLRSAREELKELKKPSSSATRRSQ